MVKRRERKTPPSAAAIDAWAAGADGKEHDPIDFLDKTAERNFKSIRVSFNEYEYRTLKKLAQATDRTMVSTIRSLIVDAAEAQFKGGGKGNL